MIHYILSFLFLSQILFADPQDKKSIICNKMTQPSTESHPTVEKLSIGGINYLIRKGTSNYCYVEAQVKGKEKEPATQYPLFACDNLVASESTSEISCVQGEKKIIYGKEDLHKRIDQKKEERSKYVDLCDDFISQKWSIREDGKNAPPAPDKLRGNIELGYDVEKERCYLRHSRAPRLYCDEVYETTSGNKIRCLDGYKEQEIVGELSQGTLVHISNLLKSELYLCTGTNRFSFTDIPTTEPAIKEDILIENCSITVAGKQHTCPNGIILKESGLFCSYYVNKDGKDKPTESFIRPIIPEARLVMYEQFLKDLDDNQERKADNKVEALHGKITVIQLHKLIENGWIVIKDKELQQIIGGAPMTREGLKPKRPVSK